MAFIELNHVSKTYGKGSVRAVDDLSLRIERGEFVVLVGSSGCGKSTTLRLVAGLETPDAGTISLAGRDITRTAPADRDVAMVFQDYALYPHMTVFENIAFPLTVRKTPKSEREERVRGIADMLGIADVLDRKPTKLSGGQQQRVAIGRALVRDPSAFLMDEPLSNLDAKLRTQMRDELARIHRATEATILYVTHDQTEAMTLATRIVVMDRGRVQQIGTPRELYCEPANLFVAGFIGSPSMNFIECRIDRGCLWHAGERIEAADPIRGYTPRKGRRLLAGFRPEHVSVEPVACGSAAPGWMRLEAQFEREEIVGSDAFLVASTRTARIVGKTGMDALGRFRPGQPVALCLDTASLLLFDAESGERLRTS